jgi:hypothetical protein
MSRLPMNELPELFPYVEAWVTGLQQQAIATEKSYPLYYPCPASWRHWRHNHFIQRQIDICAAVITQGDVILLVTQFCDMPERHL